jgi:hypothetical protein
VVPAGLLVAAGRARTGVRVLLVTVLLVTVLLAVPALVQCWVGG